MLTGVAYGHKWTEFHSWVNVEKETIVAEDIIAWHQDCWVLYFILSFDFDGGVVEAESTFAYEIELCYFIRWFTKSKAPRFWLNIFS